MARPTKLTPELISKAKEYLATCEDEEIERGTDDKPIYHIKVKLPTKGGLARFLDVSRDSLYEWAKESEEFSDIMEALSAEQEDKLINNGLSGDYNPTISKVLLTKHGYHDKVETDITTGGEKIQMSPEKLLIAKEYEDKLKEQL